ncbi:EI24 domain-containing protein [Lacisediminihabitans sp.]|jgi:CysZ protein|uniref:EI24 domain-containing protein n=1 Tax=Lacisediminihabitans sp. TaxID=2787631 RepID=UPI002F953DA9
MGAARRFGTGVGYLGAGLRLWVTSPRLMLLGAIPAFIVGIVYAAAFVLFLVNLDSIAAWAVPFATQWGEPWRTATRVVAAAALVGGLAFAAVFTFAAVTLAVGDPFYEKIWRATERTLGEEPADLHEPAWRAAARGIGSGIRLFGLTVAVGALLFACGFIPVVGQTVVPVLGALLGGWILALELTGFAFDARGQRLGQRRRALGANRAAALGFGIPIYLLFLVPFAAVVIMPAAVAGATLLARGALDREPLTSRQQPRSPAQPAIAATNPGPPQ